MSGLGRERELASGRINAKRSPRRRTAPQETSREWWEAATHAMLVRSHGRCERCGRDIVGETRVERHHRMRRRDGGDRLANLLLLHQSCHQWITEHPHEAQAEGWIVPVFAGMDVADVPVRISGYWWTLDDLGGRSPVP